ncbi:PAN2-PAN3 deadenylation complex subunit pan3-like [Dysidea avara]|uniref:PAN2-PAN3 deadenylation complex subunit pan3-like n=1 Tax=Dysidea avara TaxID=196820 RepID=UPI003330B5C9
MSKVKKQIPCRHYAASGCCFYGDQCQFMHMQLNTTPFHNDMPPPMTNDSQPPAPPQPQQFSHAASFTGLNFTAGRGVPRLPPSNPLRVGVASRGLPAMMNNLSLRPKQPMPVTATAAAVTPIPGAASIVVRPSFPIHAQQRPPPIEPVHLYGKKLPTQPVMMGPRMRMRAPNLPPATSTKIESVGGTTYFYQTDHQLQYLPSQTSFNYTPTHVNRAKPNHHHNNFFIHEDQKEELLRRQMLAAAQLPPDNSTVPTEVECYHSLFPLEPESAATPDKINQSLFGYVSTCYKAVNAKSKSFCVLRRLHGFKLSSAKAVQEVHRWRKVSHVNVVALYEMFTTKLFGDNSLVLVYDYHAGADTLLYKHFHPYNQKPSPLSESLIWQYIIQLSSALRTVHHNELAVRCIDMSKLLVLGSTRVWFNCCGLVDVITYDVTQPEDQPQAIKQKQQADLVSFGQLLLCLCCQSLMATQPENFAKSIQHVSRIFSPDMLKIIQYLLGSQNSIHNISEVMPMIGARFYSSIESLQINIDSLESQLSRELENGRLFRLITKLGVINERPEFGSDVSWSETGDRYLLKLFRDYLFHQVTPSGTPWIDLAHVVLTLNKLDAGVQEKVCLSSRDGQTVLVVTYADLKACVESAFAELCHHQQLQQMP